MEIILHIFITNKLKCYVIIQIIFKTHKFNKNVNNKTISSNIHKQYIGTLNLQLSKTKRPHQFLQLHPASPKPLLNNKKNSHSTSTLLKHPTIDNVRKPQKSSNNTPKSHPKHFKIGKRGGKVHRRSHAALRKRVYENVLVS